MLRAARQKLSSSSAPSMISALENPSLPNRVCSALVFAASRLAFSSTTMSPSLVFAESACLSAHAPLLRRAEGVAAHQGAERPPAAAEDVHARRAVTRIAGSLLAIELLAGA